MESPCSKVQRVLKREVGWGWGLKARFLRGEALLLITYLCKLQTISFIPETNINIKGRGPQLAGLRRKLLPAEVALSPGPAIPHVPRRALPHPAWIPVLILLPRSGLESLGGVAPRGAEMREELPRPATGQGHFERALDGLCLY